MIKKKLALIVALAMASPLAAHATNATETMASIMLKLNHQPSATEKKDLQSIIDSHSVTENERRLASSLINMDHSVRQEDKPKLRSVMVDPGASEQERELAKILYQVEHQVSDADKPRLSKLTKTGDATSAAEPKAAVNPSTKPAAAKKIAPAKTTPAKPASKPQ
ncbi:MAG: hypothetical protein HY272_04870 [Gammaproteobacteria bacterium]|nr:hypothetical protein [Gammaproteobacteria bacterium]